MLRPWERRAERTEKASGRRGWVVEKRAASLNGDSFSEERDRGRRVR
jgi:hypothetical protein